MNLLKVNINKKNGEISVMNNGKGIPVQIHKEYNIYVPDLIFGHLLTSSNYNDEEKKVTGGRNGYGAKLANIFSKQFSVETADHKTGKKFKKVWYDNMSKSDPDEITPYKEDDFTKISFIPDFKKFHMKELDQDILDLFNKRVYDMAGVIGGNVKVYLNDELIKIRNFSNYVDMYMTA
jgi:DNA topoisomerase II